MTTAVERSEHPVYWPRSEYVNESRAGKPGDLLAPAYRLQIFKRGTKKQFPEGILDEHILSLKLEGDVKMATKLEMELANPGHIVSDSEYLEEGNEVEASFGYAFQTFFQGGRVQLVKSLPTFPRDDVPTFVVKGYDARHTMALGKKLPKHVQKKKQRRWKTAPSRFPTMRDDQVITKLADHYKMAVDVDRTEGKKTRVRKKDTSPWEFILKLAKLNGFHAWVDWDDTHGWTLHFRKIEIRPSKYYTLHWKEKGAGEILEASVELEATKQATDVEVLAFDRNVRKVATVALSEDKELRTISARSRLKGGNVFALEESGARVRFTAFGRTMEIISDRPFKSQKEAKKYAETWINEREADFIICTGTLIGIENIRERQIHKLVGLGKKYSGFYMFDQVTQNWQKGGVYETPFVAHRVMPDAMKVKRKVQVTVFDFEGAGAFED